MIRVGICAGKLFKSTQQGEFTTYVHDSIRAKRSFVISLLSTISVVFRTIFLICNGLEKTCSEHYLAKLFYKRAWYEDTYLGPIYLQNTLLKPRFKNTLSIYKKCVFLQTTLLETTLKNSLQLN